MIDTKYIHSTVPLPAQIGEGLRQFLATGNIIASISGEITTPMTKKKTVLLTFNMKEKIVLGQTSPLELFRKTVGVPIDSTFLGGNTDSSPNKKWDNLHIFTVEVPVPRQLTKCLVRFKKGGHLLVGTIGEYAPQENADAISLLCVVDNKKPAHAGSRTKEISVVFCS